ncbi:16S rRNA (guanine(966)-N(2))-methyltransferase RsmD [Pseudodesulfovibrio sediminis]|uniref:Methyltransferase n=1 Tax=Pseudodesulfovibrio sediminis TaxID=2810563 RepID=A0ABN6EPE2_9BACT|nr:16S rRNA (guanine(966)-N(2))-methyltransferase RsmD [Pseudodesulfovibrio sediminis]BCS86999.1 methyltransferase [Pseudodesulfovibrio sediminis]
MRIVGGQYKGRRIKTCEGPGYRPATMKVRESIFSMLMARGICFPDVRVIDMFAGSGSLALECLSRGTTTAWFVEKSAKAAGLIRKNLAELNVPKQYSKVVSKDLFGVLSKQPEEPFDLVFIDPPYGKDLLIPALEKALKNGWIASGAFVLAEVETAIEAPTEGPIADMELLTDREYGQTRIFLWRN